MKSLIFFFLIFSISGFAQVNFAEIDSLITAGKFQKAKEILLKSPSKNLEVNRYLGDISGYQKDWDEATTYYKRLVDKEPSNADYNFKYGGALGLKALTVSRFQALTYISDIKKYLEKAATLDSKHVNSREALVELYMQLPGIIGGSEEKSRKYASELERIDPVRGAMARGYIFQEKGDRNKAREKYREAMSILKNTPRGDYSNAVYFKLGRASADYQVFPTVGLELLDNFISTYSFKESDPLEWAYYYKAQIHAHLNDKSEALKSIEKALALKGNFEEALAEKQRILALK